MSEYALGQRWVSHADVELGLGIVVEVDPRRVTVHFPAVGEDRTYATHSAPLTRLALKPGDSLLRRDGHRFEVIAVDEVDGVIAYAGIDDAGEKARVSELELDAHVQLSAPKDRLLNNQLDKLVDFKLRYATLQHIATADTGTARGLLGARTSLLSHQMYIADEVGRRFAPRVLLADEVGLGKTIEAGLILSQQLLSGRAQRVLVLVPDALVHQWLVEMMRRFNLHFSLFDQSRLTDAGEDSPFDNEQLVLCPFSLFSGAAEPRALALNVDWDMVVVDEAHHLSHENNAESHLYAFIERLAELSRGLLLLTATPEQAGIESHFARLKLLDPDRFANIEEFLDEQRHYGEWNTLIEQLQRGEVTLPLPSGIDMHAEPEQQIQQLLDRYGTGRVLFRNTRASVPGFPKRHLHSYPLSCPAIYQGSSTRLYPEQQADESNWLADDPRVHWLEQQLRSLRPAKALVICASAATALALEHHLHMRAGIRCAAFHEGLSLVERDRAAAFFADDIGGAQALICSEIGSEGRNFQFAHHLICFDLPLNPDLLEQRIGRLDRIGQSSDVHIHVPFLESTAQQILFHWMDQGLQAFTHPCAVGHTVFSQFESALTLALDNPVIEASTLYRETAAFRSTLEAEMQAGRDRLLEINSHNPERGRAVIEAVRAQEAPEVINEFAELLFDRIGVNQDYHSDTCFVLRPSEMLLTGQLPYLDEDGITVTFDRATALARDDVHFLTWEHPLIREAMAVVAGSELGNAVIGTLKHPQIRPGTVLLEAIYSVDCLAPAHLELGRFINMTPLRFVLTPDLNNVANKLSHEVLNRLLEPVPTTTSASVMRQIRPVLEKQLASVDQQAHRELDSLRNQALNSMATSLGAERARLEYLRDVNPSIRAEEIDAIDTRIADSERALATAQVTAQALRIIIAT